MARRIAIIVAALLLIAAAGCEHRTAADLPACERVANWHWSGSCGWASLCDLLKAGGWTDQADYVRQHCYGGTAVYHRGNRVVWSAIGDECDKLGVPHEDTASGDLAFLQHACDDGPGAVIAWYGTDGKGFNGRRFYGFHAVDVVNVGDAYVEILDCNYTQTYFLPIGDFIREWRKSGGWAITIGDAWTL